MALKSPLVRAVSALATAGAVAHGAFFVLFAWRIATAGMFGVLGRFGYMALAFGSVVGLVSNLVGWSLVRHGGRIRAQKYGLMALALSTGLAAVSLGFAALTGAG